MSSTDIFRAKGRRHLAISGKVLLPLVLLGFVSLVIFLHQQFFTVKNVECRSPRPCPESITSIIDQTKGQSFLRLNQRRLRERIEATGLANDVRIIPIFPGKLVVAIEPPSVTFVVQSVFTPTPPSLSINSASTQSAIVPPSLELAAYVATVSGKTFALLSTGVLNQEEAKTPFFLISENIPDREYLSKTFDWLKSLGESRIQPEALYLLPHMIVVKQKDQPDWIVDFEASPGGVLLALQRLREVVTIKKPSVIDFRYANPILK